MDSFLIKRYEECRLYLRYWKYKKHVPTKKFIIFTHWRSGSELLVNLLNSHPNICCDGEIFLDFCQLSTPRVLAPHWYMNGKSCGRNADVYGFKLMSDQLGKILILRSHKGPNKYLNYLLTNGWKIIYLLRQNIFRKALSSLVAQSTNTWHVKSRQSSREKIRIDPGQLLERMKGYENDMANEEKDLKNNPHLTIIYEEGLLEMENHQKTIDTVCDYIGIPAAPVKTQLKRTSSDCISKTIENFEVIYDVVRQSPYAHFLDSDLHIPIPGNPIGLE